jgi:ribosome-associated protein
VAANAATSPAKAAPEKDPGTSEELLARIIDFLESEKAEELVQIDLRGRSQIADYMVVCSGRSTRQVTALAEKLTDTIKLEFGRFPKMEGKAQGDWVLLDTGDVVVHVFRPEVREFYQLEKMWLPGGAEAE